MKKDILREFVSVNRDAFDDEEPGSYVLDKIRGKLKSDQANILPRSKVIKFQYWWAAAILLICIAYIAVLEHHTESRNAIAHKAEVRHVIPPIPTSKEDLKSTEQPVVVAAKGSEKNKAATQLMRVNVSIYIDSKMKIADSNTIVNDWGRALQSGSSSVRLAAILDLGKGNPLLSDSDLQRLFKTMNDDESSNVRLAVLDVLKKLASQPLVEDFILQSVASQDDPVVQIELLSSLSSDEAIKIKQQLLDLSQDSIHIDLVRDQAYAVLIRSNINFNKSSKNNHEKLSNNHYTVLSIGFFNVCAGPAI